VYIELELQSVEQVGAGIRVRFLRRLTIVYTQMGHSSKTRFRVLFPVELLTVIQSNLDQYKKKKFLLS
jgi:hypothetical protein